MKLTDSLQMVKGVGPKNFELLQSIGLSTVADFIDYWPRKYEDYSTCVPISRLMPGRVTVRGRFESSKSRRSRRGLHLTEAILTDTSGSLKVVWFNQPYRAASLKPDTDYLVSGEYALKSGQLSVTNPRVELASDITENTGAILPVYRESKTITSVLLRKIARHIEPYFDYIEESLPDWIVESEKLMPRAAALRELHLPMSSKSLSAAKDRLGFEEVFQMQLSGRLLRLELAKVHAPVVEFDEVLAREFVSHLKFTLTPDQKRTVWQIYKDMAKDEPMNRLVEGDVGSGKTVVAAMAAIMAMREGLQVLFMAPTEILARQHATTLSSLLEHTEWSSRLGLLVGSLPAKQKSLLHTKIASGECQLVVGTNALVQDKVIANNAGLVIIDEQHRFGVEQRIKLKGKTGLSPHVLCMTATPIPRTLALTLYGELDVTQLKSMPVGRTPIITEVVSPNGRAALYKTIDEAIAEGRQAFIVCPLIEENKDLGLMAAETLYESLKSKHFRHRRVGLLHGSMKPADKDAVMATFKAGDIDVLVTTTVIEVGVDVPNASIMVVESAERFGLAQIHQLRGRVGRGEHKGFCYLVPTEEQFVSRRLRALTTIRDGFKLAELDLELRGPGAIYGLKQSGALDLRIAELTDEKLILRARKQAEEFVQRGEKMVKYPVLADRVRHFMSISHLN